MLINKQELLQEVYSVSPGIDKKSSIQQSSCIVLKNGKLCSYNGEVYCETKSNLDKGWNNIAIEFTQLTKLLASLEEDTIIIKLLDNKLIIKGKGKTATLAIENEINLPLDFVEMPKKDAWKKISEEFGEAVQVVTKCTTTKQEFLQACIHMHPEYIEASDANQIARWKLKTFVKEPILVRATNLASIIPFGIIYIQETDNWLHFKNSTGLRISIQKYPVEKYPDLGKHLDIQGTKIVFPSNIKGAITRAELFIDESENDSSVEINIQGNKITVHSAGISGTYQESKKTKKTFKSSNLKQFLIEPKLFLLLLNKNNACEITPTSLRISNNPLTYVVSLKGQT